MMDYRKPAQPGSNKKDQGGLIYSSFAGADATRNTNGILAESPYRTMWWDEERIEATVTRQFVLANLHPEEQARLDEPLGFGDGLTDDTYMEWIDLKAKRLFLILVDLNVPDQIFGIIDDSWDDDDLPIPLDQVERLQLTYDKDEKLERKFFHRQFLYLLRSIQKGDQLVYEEEEVVPLEQAERKAVGQVAGLTQSNVDKVHLPGRPDDVFVRRRVPLGIAAGRMPHEEFLSGLEAMRTVEHNHLVSIWASYIHHDSGYLLLTPANDTTLKNFLAVTPPSFKILAKQDRRILLLNWMHCLADAVSFLHGLGQSHKNIKPSTVMLDHDNHIFLGDSGVFSTSGLVGEKRSFDKESYDYASPEHALRPSIPTPILVPMTSPVARPGSARRSTLSNGGTSTFSSEGISPITSSSTWSPFGGSSTISSTSNSPPRNSPPKRNSLPSRHDPQKSDVFALGTIFLEILTFFMKKASSKFASHRSAKNKTPGRGGGLPDSSFHKNLGQVESWVAGLAKDALKKEDKIFRGIDRLLILTEKMLSANPEERPTAEYVKTRIHAILTEFCGMGHQGTTPDGKPIPSKGRIHCDGHRMDDEEDWNFGFEELRIASQQAAAKACANVNPSGTELRTVGLNGGLVYGIERNSVATSGGYTTNSSSGGASIARSKTRDTDGMSTITRSSNKSSEGRSKSGGGSLGMNGGNGKVKPKVKQWQAPVYAEMSFG